MTDRPNNQDAEITEPAHPSDDELSAYLNRDSVDLTARRRLEAHLETCADCRERLAELRTVVRLLHGMGSPVPKRSFRLDPSMASVPLPAPPPEPVRIDSWIVRAQPALRRLTAIAAVLLVLLVTADILTHRNSSDNGSREVSALSSASRVTDGTSVMSAGAAESASKSTAAAAQVPASTAASTSGSANGGESSASGSSVAPSAAGAAAFSTTTSGSTASDAASANTTETPAATAAALALQQTEASGQPPAEAAPAPNAATHGGRSSWRLVELAVGVVVIWLLFLTIVLPRLSRQRRS